MMKKIVSVFLAAVMVFAAAFPVLAAPEGKSEYPIIRILGNGNEIYDEYGNLVYNFDYDTSQLANDVAQICLPHLLTGLATGDYSDYYDALYEKISEIYGNAKLDENGEPLAGTDISKSDRNYMAVRQNQNLGGKGYFNMGDYHFWYDWRLDPLQHADELNDYINHILKATGKEKVSLYGRCIGGTPIVAYLAKYGSEKIDTVCLDSTVTNGGEMIGDVFTGNLNLNTDALLRFANGYFSGSDDSTGDMLFDIIISTVRLLNSAGVSEEIIQLFMDNIYEALGDGFISAFTRASFATWPSYWTMVKADDFEKAKTVIFGEEDSELRKTYSGLIAKLDKYHDTVTSKMPEILKHAKESGTKFCIISKYGYQLFPYVGSYDELSDRWVSVKNSSYGATTALINETLSPEYIAQKTEQGLGRYISVDKEIDASTCYLPDNTWFIKGNNHDDWQDCIEALSYAVCASDSMDVSTNEKYPQFMFYDSENRSLTALTEENMNCEDYYDFDTGSTETLSKKERLFKTLMVLFDWIKKIFTYLSSLFTK